jgi:hypothetical protein
VSDYEDVGHRLKVGRSRGREHKFMFDAEWQDITSPRRRRCDLADSTEGRRRSLLVPQSPVIGIIDLPRDAGVHERSQDRE